MLPDWTGHRTAPGIRHADQTVAAEDGLEAIRRYDEDLAKVALAIMEPGRIAPPGREA